MASVPTGTSGAQPASPRSAVWTGCPYRAAKLGSYWVDPEPYKIWKEIKRGQKAVAPWEQGRRHICGLFWGPLLRTETNSSITSFPAWEGAQLDVQGIGITFGGAASPPSPLQGEHCSSRAHRDPGALQEGTSVLFQFLLLSKL